MICEFGVAKYVSTTVTQQQHEGNQTRMSITRTTPHGRGDTRLGPAEQVACDSPCRRTGDQCLSRLEQAALARRCGRVSAPSDRNPTPETASQPFRQNADHQQYSDFLTHPVAARPNRTTPIHRPGCRPGSGLARSLARTIIVADGQRPVLKASMRRRSGTVCVWGGAAIDSRAGVIDEPSFVARAG